ncbi:uncharacterized protein LOC105160597 [Sesamum indicum]|uniref:Uncharacterized protein LOC105160597 n=1 Tax=Sesamum indicum TaxID=4182 RepID=A0A6I9T7B2_SESIN|nr:uncharacterized protein LOC105160597 [Sesamum indicum]
MPLSSCFFIFLTCFIVHACDSHQLLGLSTSDFQNKFSPDKLKQSEERLKVSMNLGQNPIGNRMPTVGSERKEEKDEGLNCKKNKGNRVGEVLHFSEGDLIETDYQPPHRRSPIHNK